MSVPAAAMLFLGGLLLTIASSLVLARRLDSIGRRLGFSEALLGIATAVGADAPEIASAVAAIVAGHRDTGVGVVVGSNVFNVAALLGLSAVVAGPVRLRRHGLILDAAVALAVALVGALLVFRWLPAWIALIVALAVLVPYVLLVSVAPRRLRRLPAPLRAAAAEERLDARRDEDRREGTQLDALAVVAALTAVVGGAAAMVSSAQSLGTRWRISDVVIGTLVLAALTGIPNVIAAVRLARHGRGAACLSESLNSNNANVLVGLCVPALILGIGVPSGLERFAAAAMLVMSAVALSLAYGGNRLTRREGAAIIVLYVGFVLAVVFG